MYPSEQASSSYSEEQASYFRHLAVYFVEKELAKKKLGRIMVMIPCHHHQQGYLVQLHYSEQQVVQLSGWGLGSLVDATISVESTL